MSRACASLHSRTNNSGVISCSMEGYRGKGEVIYSALIIPEPNSKGQNVCSIVCNFGHCLLHLVCCLVT